MVWIGGHIVGLLKSLPPSIGIFRLGLDGMDSDTFHRFDVDATVDCYANELLRARCQGPLVIAGFSYTGLLAYAARDPPADRTGRQSGSSVIGAFLSSVFRAS